MRRNSRGACVAAALAVLLSPVVPLAAQPQNSKKDVVLEAMRDELRRAGALRVANLGPPYYTEYSIHQGQSLTIAGTLGALLHVQRNRFRQPDVEVRVGSPEFDNTNYIFSGFNFGSPYDLRQPPLDDNYQALREYFWLATDQAYKSAQEVIARKRAALKNYKVSEEIPDFAKAKPVQIMLEVKEQPVDADVWEERVRSLSALFAGYPRIISSRVELQAVQGTFYFVNSEGTEVKAPERLMHLRVTASALAPDGMNLRNATVFHSHDFARMSSEAEVREGILRVAKDLTALAEAPVGEAYTGPVLFEGRAGAQLFAEVLGRNLAPKRRPVSEPGRRFPFQESELEGRQGSRILPEWMDVVDDPTQKEWNGQPLLGYYEVDLEGVRPEPVDLVQHGILKNFLMTRQPVRGFEGSNGRARLPGRFGAKTADFGNLFVKAGETMTEDGLKKKLLDLCRQRGKPYGIIIRKMDFPSSASLGELRRLTTRMAQSGGLGSVVSLPILAYRVYPDGREELVRGMRFQGVSTRSLKDIIAASDKDYVFEFLNNSAPFALMGGAGYVAESSVIAPSVLLEDVQLERSQDELPKPPVAPPPTLTATQ